MTANQSADCSSTRLLGKYLPQETLSYIFSANTDSEFPLGSAGLTHFSLYLCSLLLSHIVYKLVLRSQSWSCGLTVGCLVSNWFTSWSYALKQNSVFSKEDHYEATGTKQWPTSQLFDTFNFTLYVIRFSIIFFALFFGPIMQPYVLQFETTCTNCTCMLINLSVGYPVCLTFHTLVCGPEIRWVKDALTKMLPAENRYIRWKMSLL